MHTSPTFSWEDMTILLTAGLFILSTVAGFSLGYATGDWSLVAGEWVLRPGAGGLSRG